MQWRLTKGWYRGWRCSVAFISGFTISFFDLSSPQKFNLSNNLLSRHGKQSSHRKLTKYSGIPIGSVTGVQFAIIICPSALCEVVALGSAGTTTPVRGGWLYKRHPQGCISSPPQQVGTVVSFSNMSPHCIFLFFSVIFWIPQVGCTDVSFQRCLHTVIFFGILSGEHWNGPCDLISICIFHNWNISNHLQFWL